MGKFKMRLVDFLGQKVGWSLFYGPCSTWRVGHLDQDILMVWPYYFFWYGYQTKQLPSLTP